MDVFRGSFEAISNTALNYFYKANKKYAEY